MLKQLQRKWDEWYWIFFHNDCANSKYIADVVGCQMILLVCFKIKFHVDCVPCSISTGFLYLHCNFVTVWCYLLVDS